MTLIWFLEESKSYMGYPTTQEEFAEHDHSDLVNGKTTKQRKVDFWKKFPRAFVKFYFTIPLKYWFSKLCRARQKR